MSTSELLIFSGIAAFWGLIIFGAMRGNSDKAIVQRAKTEGRHRIVEIEGKQFHAISKTEVILRSKSGRARAVLVAVGRERDPVMVNGKMEMRPRWIKIRSFTRRGLSEHERWVSANGWTREGEQEIEYHLPVK
ncbi:MAG: hypothetical protein ACOY4L_00685 [Pseudomonadota bacterium]